eukprot:89619-Pleurochrysis_carterae.AAC.1
MLNVLVCPALQSFSRLISGMMNYAIATIPEMAALIAKLIARAYNIVEVIELHALWDFKGWLLPH